MALVKYVGVLPPSVPDTIPGIVHNHLSLWELYEQADYSDIQDRSAVYAIAGMSPYATGPYRLYIGGDVESEDCRKLKQFLRTLDVLNPYGTERTVRAISRVKLEFMSCTYYIFENSPIGSHGLVYMASCISQYRSDPRNKCPSVIVHFAE